MDVLFLDPYIIAVHKPSGMLVHRGWADDETVAMDLARGLAGRWVYPVHRLDRGTSGVLLFALDSETAAGLQGAFERSEIEKTYIALVRGIPAEEIHVDHPVPRTEGGARVDARTHLRRLSSSGRYSLVEAKPHTGRFHQIRRHLKHVSHPIIGDVNYGKGEHNRFFRETFGLHRLGLHAGMIAFTHPRTGVAHCLRASVPEDLSGPLARAGFAPQVWEEPFGTLPEIPT